MFHGSNHVFVPGDVVRPGEEDDSAYATNKPEYARQYGKHVYEVEPIDKPVSFEDPSGDPDEPSETRTIIHASEKGFKVRRRL